MKRLGISIYPEHGTLEEQLKYIKMASENGFKRIFTCLISVGDNIEESINDFKVLTSAAGEYGMEVIADVSPDVFEALDIDYRDMSLFKEIGLTGIRLDLGFSGVEESTMTHSSEGIKVELNMSQGTRYLDNILSYQPQKSQLIGCHNFYPHRYTGLSVDHFIKCSEQFKKEGIRTAAFVSSNHAQFGPWPVSEGLPTLEHHRSLPVLAQAKELFNTGLIDDVIIGNAYASEEELKQLGAMNKECLTLNVKLHESITELMKTIVLNEPHFNRGDVSEYMIRSTQSRVKYKNEAFPCINAVAIKKGDVLIESSLYSRYAGELQIALKDMDNSGKTNVVGRIVDEELHLIDAVLPWQHFKFEQAIYA